MVLVFNNADKPTFGTFVSTKPGYKILGKIELPDASDGVEQSIYVKETGLFYSSVPVWKDDNNKGGLAITDPKTMKMVELVSIPGCQPTGLTQGLGTHLLVGSEKLHRGLRNKIEIVVCTSPHFGEGCLRLASYLQVVQRLRSR